jgi:hypothetical protein
MGIVRRELPTFEMLKQELREADGVKTVSVEHLLMILGRERAASRIRENLREELEEYRIGVLGDIPASKYSYVRLFDLELPSGILYRDLMTPGHEQDERLRELIDHDCRKKLRMIRSIVYAPQSELEGTAGK